MTWPGTPDLPARDLVLAHLAQDGRGRDKAITQRALAQACGVSVRDVQAAIEELRRDGIPVCTGSRGCWLTDDADELRENYRSLRGRALTQMGNLRRMLRTAEALEKPLTLWKDEEAA